MTRAARRAARQWMIQRWIRRIKETWYLGELTDADVLAMARIRARTRQPCSCAFCGQRRWLEGPPIQERRQGLA